MVERSDRTWSTGEGNGKPLQYSFLENLILEPSHHIKDETVLHFYKAHPQLLSHLDLHCDFYWDLKSVLCMPISQMAMLTFRIVTLLEDTWKVKR